MNESVPGAGRFAVDPPGDEPLVTRPDRADGTTATGTEQTPGTDQRPVWWRHGVVYQIYPRSFADANGDGVGDLPGILAHLDHLVDLGVDALWLSPIFRSPMRDFGYDVSDHCDVDPVFGTLADADALVAEAHRRGLKVLLDWVPNHTSSDHPWFVASRSSRTDPKRDWYVWRDGRPDGSPPNNWRREFAPAGGAPAWTFDATTGQWYLHLFLPDQPDLNWAHPEVEAAMHDTLRFWLDRGVDGFRMDVVHCIGKDPALPDDPPDLPYGAHVPFHDDPSTHVLLRRIRALLDAQPGERVAVGEVVLLDPDRLAAYHGTPDQPELHLAFNFSLLYAPWRSDAFGSVIDRTERAMTAVGAWPTWALGNHDLGRIATRFGSPARARAAAVLLLSLRGTPFVYAGDELGLADADVPAGRAVDPGGRDGCRAPIPWTAGPGHGWSADPWLPFPPDTEAHAVDRQRADPTSTLALYRRLLARRRACAALHAGDFEWVLDHGADGVLAWRRTAGAEVRLVIVNFRAERREVTVGGAWVVESASDDPALEGQPFDGVLAPDRAVVLAPAGAPI